MRLEKTRRKSPMAEINVVPYIDVMLVLLVIFMITAPMLTQGITVELPRAQSDQVQSTGREPTIVSVDNHGAYYLNINTNPGLQMDPNALMVRVAAELALAKENKEKLDVLVKGDQGVPYGKVVGAMGLLKQAGAEQVGLLTDSTSVQDSTA